jgi:thymidylate synthase
MSAGAPSPEFVEQRRELLALLERLHRHKDAAYGDAWRKRGEVIAIFANMARKYDRLQVAFDEQKPAATEALGDTLGDLCVYVAKYLTWIAERHPDCFRKAVTGIDPQEISPAHGPEPLATTLAAVANETAIAVPSSANAAWQQVQESFETLDRALMAQSTPGAPSADLLDFRQKAAVAWRLCGQISWLAILLEHENPGALDALRKEITQMDRRAAL